MNENFIQHFGILGMRWGVRRYQDSFGRLTAAGKQRYSDYKTRQREKLLDDVANAKDKSLMKLGYETKAGYLVHTIQGFITGGAGGYRSKGAKTLYNRYYDDKFKFIVNRDKDGLTQCTNKFKKDLTKLILRELNYKDTKQNYDNMYKIVNDYYLYLS